ncbi:prepilin-type N-terminal cleavage/methylation domain-containing protein [Pelagicoccus sp. SDUM812005]|uniref:prepilin-type N-terminal cleavage/methylation domain-containing protein n=1 Tax=Pelagicoccus sp. SDUM812005 TaxID=3041257 RepID=UPI00280E63D6|nr:prepilin-type N-terminal cleavage/methylation domain-containing protein [Pelagicoccus sp. SDUM812005]MDQ8182459.1 prepilin-type N-terminal cleavage/methylation domain-containing protein [Pelagicoccus sp. SDUM812005]
MIPTPTQLSSRPEQGFTLLELMVVAAIIAILVSIGSVTFFSQRGEAKKDRARADLQVIQQGLEAYRARFGDYPRYPDNFPAGIASEEAYLLNALCGQIGPAGHKISGSGIPVMLNTSLLSYSNPGLPFSGLQENAIVDPWGKTYEYDDEPKNADDELLFGYILRSAGPDGEFNTEEDNIVAQ